MAEKGAGGARPPSGSVFREPDFVRLWIVGLTLFSVRWIEALAISVFVYQRTGSEFAVTLMMMWRVVPMTLFGAFLGAWSERIERRSALLLILLGSLATSLAIGILALLGRLEIWHLGGASFINGIAWTCDNPIRRYMLSQVVGTARLGSAMAVDVGTNNASRVLGPTIGGILLVSWGIEGAFLAGTLAYLVGLGAAIGLTCRNEPREHAIPNVLRQVAEGWRETRSNEQLRGIFVVTFIFNIFCWPTVSLIPVIGESGLRLAPEWVGVLSSTDGAGTLLGALLIGTLAPRRWFGRLFVGGMVVYAGMMALFAAAAEPVAAAALLVLVGLGGAGFSIMQATLVLLVTPHQQRGAVLGLLTVCIGIAPLGLVLIGAMAQGLGAAAAVITFSLLGIAATVATCPMWKPVWLGSRAR